MEKFVLNRLLDKVETRRQASGESLVRRRVSLKTDSLPEYHGRELDYRKAFHQAAENLQRQELLEIEWLRGSGVPFYVNAGGRPVVTRAAVVGAGDAPPVLRAWQPAVAAASRRA